MDCSIPMHAGTKTNNSNEDLPHIILSCIFWSTTGKIKRYEKHLKSHSKSSTTYKYTVGRSYLSRDKHDKLYMYIYADWVLQ